MPQNTSKYLNNKKYLDKCIHLYVHIKDNHIFKYIYILKYREKYALS